MARLELQSLQNVTLWGAGFATIAGWLAAWHWLLELFSHFRLQYIVILLVLTLIYAFQRRWAGTLIALLLCGINVPPVAAMFEPGGNTVAGNRSPIVLISANLNSRNDDVSAVENFLRSETVDILVLQEFTFRWATDLSVLQTEFPYHFELPREDNFGLALYSRWPLSDIEAIALGDSTPALNATVATPHGPLQLVAVHLRPPMTATWAAERTAQFKHLSGLAQISQLPLAVVGDFNATPWSPEFRNWTATSKLKNGPTGKGLAYTWPVAIPLFWIPIDACVVNDGLTVVSQRRGSAIGSDHYPLITTVQMASQ